MSRLKKTKQTNLKMSRNIIYDVEEAKTKTIPNHKEYKKKIRKSRFVFSLLLSSSFLSSFFEIEIESKDRTIRITTATTTRAMTK